MLIHSKFLSAAGVAVVAALTLGSISATAANASTPTDGAGLLVPTHTVIPQRVLGATAYGDGLPDSVDLRSFAPTPGDQGSLNSCVSWALGYTIAGWYAKKLGVSQLFAPMYIYSQTHLSNTQDGGGSYVRDALNIELNQGVDTIDDYQPQGNYDFTDAPTAAQTTNAAFYKNTYSTTMFASGSGNIGTAAQTSIESSLAAGIPVGLGIPIYQNFYYLNSTNYNFPLSAATGSIYGYHYLAALGYDSTGVWVENSWGTYWGQAGFAHLSWDFVESRAIEAESVNGFAASSIPAPVVTTPTPTATPTPDPTATTPVVTPTTDPTTPVVTPTTEPTTPVVTPTTTPTTDPTTPVVTPTTEPTTPVVTPTQPSTPVVTPTQPSTPTTQPSNPVITPNQPVTPPVVNVPSTPQNLSIAPAATSLTFNWKASTAQGATYHLTIKGGGKTWTAVTSGTSYNATKLQPNTTYTVSIMVQNTAGHSSTVTRSLKTAPAAPSIATLKAISSKGKYTFTWKATQATGSTLTRYIVSVKSGSKAVSNITYKTNVHSAKITLKGKKTYTVTLTAYNKYGEHTTKTIKISIK